jgi:Methyltransferase domain
MGFREVLRSEAVWALSGVTFPSAVYSTHGRVVTGSDYLSWCGNQMDRLLRGYGRPARALEFGSGVGGNLIAAAHRFDSGLGIDVNRLYLAWARGLARFKGVGNVRFEPYDGVTISTRTAPFSLVFSIGVFERLPHSTVESYVHQLANLTDDIGTLALYFLMSEALDTNFVRRLGKAAYAPWTDGMVRSLAERLGLTVLESRPWAELPSQQGGGSLVVSRMYFMRRGGRV